MHKGAKRLLLFFIKLLVTALVIVLALRFVAGVYVIHSNDMYPVLCDGDLLITYKLTRYYSGEVIAYKTDDGVTRFGRIIAVAGDEVDIGEEGTVYINGLVASERVYYETRPEELSEIKFPYRVEEGSVFILNDMRENTTDSRMFGSIDKRECLGRIVFLSRYRTF